MARQLLDEHKKGYTTLSNRIKKIPIDLSRFLGKNRYNNGFEDIFGSSYTSLGFDTLIDSGRNNKALNQVLKECF